MMPSLSALAVQSPASVAARGLLWALPVLGIGLAACHGCRSGAPATSAGPPAPADPGPPTLRLYFVTDVAGALEPCGCTKDQLGGLDHLGAWVTRSRAKAPASLLASAGPLFFMDERLDAERGAQDRAKALTIARVLHGLDFVAFAPGVNDWADGAQGLATLSSAAGATAVGEQARSLVPVVVREVGGIKVGFVGYGQPRPALAVPASGPVTGDGQVEQAVRGGVTEAERQGATVLVALAAVGRGEAKRIADAVPELTAIVVGSVKSAGDANTSAPPVERLGDVLVVQAANHLQTAAVLDLYVRETPQQGRPIRFADATGIELARKREALAVQIDDLHVKIAAWARDPRIAPKDVESRKRDLASLEAQRDALEGARPPATGSFFRYTTQEIRESLGTEPAILAQMRSYYETVHQRNRALFADRVPPPPGKDQAAYVGVDACSQCHPGPRKVYDATSHAHAYATLSSQLKELNLDCVGCHVTGYERPGGSTVTHVDKLQNVQCESCHGPGSKHVVSPTDPALIVRRPDTTTCISCHHPPHVEQFDAVAKMQEVLGPGHGLPEK
jgi:hypothetical protein